MTRKSIYVAKRAGQRAKAESGETRSFPVRTHPLNKLEPLAFEILMLEAKRLDSYTHLLIARGHGRFFGPATPSIFDMF